jgi:hypothetical protein
MNIRSKEVEMMYPHKFSSLETEDTVIVESNIDTIEGFFKFEIKSLRALEQLDVEKGTFFNQFRESEKGRVSIHKINIPEVKVGDITILKHTHTSVILNLGEDFLAIKAIDPDPVFHNITNQHLCHKRVNYYLLDSADLVLSPNSIQLSNSTEAALNAFLSFLIL